MKNESGVLAKITQVFSEHSISIDAMVQKEIQEDDEVVDIILVTSNIEISDATIPLSKKYVSVLLTWFADEH